jgi:beta-hydroxylase
MSIGVLILAVLVGSGMIIHFRGKVRHSFARQLTSHTNLTAPYNVFVYLFSKIPNIPFPKIDAHYPELKILEDNWEVIRDEALALAKAEHIKASDNYDDLAFNSFFRTGWTCFYLKWYDDFMPSALEHCPRTIELVRQIPYMKAAMFASLPPGATLPQHRDPFAGSMRYHLGLITPNSEKCSIDVDGQPYWWKDGEAVVFDETFIHTASNQSEDQRIILFADISRPMRYAWADAINNWVSTYMVKASASKNEANESVGFLNRVFGVLYYARVWAKKLKGFNRKLYYILKFTLFAILIWAIFL